MNSKISSLVVLSLTLASLGLKAQDVEENIRMKKTFKADGISNEWEEPLNQYNEATKLAFALANDDKNLYIIIESLDPQTTFSILRGSITLNINTQGKKKDGVKLTFPLIERPLVSKDGEIQHNGDKDMAALGNDDKMHISSAMNKSIKVSGFKNIKDGNLPVINENGIETGMSIHPNRDMIYELSIPLTQLEVNLDMKQPLVYNVKINQPNKPNFKKEGRPEGVDRSGGRGGMGGGRGGMRGSGKMNGGQRSPREGGDKSESKNSDFWIKYKLAKS